MLLYTCVRVRPQTEDLSFTTGSRHSPYMRPHNATHVTSYDYICPHTTICVCPHATVYLSSDHSPLPVVLFADLAMHVSSYYYVCVLILLHTSYYISALRRFTTRRPLHTTGFVSSYCHMYPHATMHLSSYCYIMLLCICPQVMHSL
jgi:hypothetical protein